MRGFCLIAAVVSLLAFKASAERGWTCVEANLLQKYKLVGNTLVTEGDPFSELMQSDNRTLGLSEYHNVPTWQVLVNNSDGLIAVMSDTGRSDKAGHGNNEPLGVPYVYADMLMVNKKTGQLQHFTSNVSAVQPSTTSKNGSCVDY